MKKKQKKLLIVLLSGALALSVTLGVSLAYLTSQTERRVNNFTFASGEDALDAQLVEHAWDGIYGYHYEGGGYAPIYGKDATGIIYGYTDNDPAQPIRTVAGATGKTNEQLRPEDGSITYGNSAAKLMIPGAVAPKNPQIFNTSTLLEEWVAAKVTFVYSTAVNGHVAGEPLTTEDYTKVAAGIEINWNNTDWEVLDSGTGTLVLFYRDLLDKAISSDYWGSEKTVPMFTQVKVKEALTTADLAELADIGGFAIFIEGFAVQGSVANDYTEFSNWAAGVDGTVWGLDDNGAVFSHTPTAASPAAVTDSIIT